MNTYRASRHVRLGVPDEHAYNMFLSVMEQCSRLGLWEKPIPWLDIQIAFHRLTNQMRLSNTARKRYAQAFLQGETPDGS